MKKCHILLSAALFSSLISFAQRVDYSVTFVPEENSLDLVKITKESDYVCMPAVNRSRNGVNWLTNRIIAISPSGEDLAYLSLRNNTTNIFIKDVNKQWASSQRTNRSAVIDFAYSPDGNKICFSEAKGKTNQIFMTDAKSGYVCRQITSGAEDYSPAFSPDMKSILFARMEKRGATVWGYDLEHNFLSSYTSGMNPIPSENNSVIFVARDSNGQGEIWKVDLTSGIEECIVSDSEKSFYSPQLSPDNKTLVMAGSSKIENEKITYWNTDIYTCNIDGTNLQQVTYHAADDLSPVWSADGQYIYFISQRGNADGTANIWRLKYK